MKSKVKYIVLLILFSFTIAAKSQTVEIQPGTPFFKYPNVKSQIVFVNSKNSKINFFEKKSIISSQHPLVGKIDFLNVKIGKDKINCWVAPNLKYSKIDHKSVISLRNTINFAHVYYILFFILLLLVVVGFKLCKKYKFSNGESIITIITLLVLLRLILVAFVLSRANTFYTYPSDEINYVKIANDILHFNFSDIAGWKYTYGYSLSLLPLLLMFGTGTYYELIREICLFNCILVASLNITLLFFIFKKISFSNIKTFACLILIIFFSFTLFPIEYWNIKFFSSVFMLNGVLQTSGFSLYNLFYNIDYVGLSHVVSMFLFLLSFFVVLYFPPIMRTIICTSVLFSLGCLVRMDTIFFVPLFGYLFWNKFKIDIKNDIKVLFKIIILSLISFIIIYFPQLIINYLSRGEIMASPYELHEIADKVKWSINILFDSGINFQISVTLVYVTLGITGMVFLEDRYLKSILILWGIPFYIFYCGYVCSGNNPVRFVQISFPALLGSFVACELWKRLNYKQLISVLLPITMSIICISPRFQYLKYYIKPNMTYLLNHYYVYNISYFLILLLSILSFFYLYKYNKKAAFFLFTFMSLYLTANVYLLFCIMIILYFETIFRWFQNIYLELKNIELK